jgi:hypothetical protein
MSKRSFFACCAPVIAFLGSLAFVSAVEARPFFAGNWNNGNLHFLDDNMVSQGSVPSGGSNPNGVASDATRVYVGHFINQTVNIFDYNGNPQGSWSSPSLGNCQGLEIVNGELATVFSGNNIDFLNPATGAFIRSIPNVAGSGAEGLAYDGNLLWVLGGNNDALIYGVNPANGAQVTTIPNPAVAAPFGGTALSTAGPGRLMVGADGGSWWRINSADGSIVNQGNNGLGMFGLAEAIPEPASLAAVAAVGAIGLARRRRA